MGDRQRGPCSAERGEDRVPPSRTRAAGRDAASGPGAPLQQNETPDPRLQSAWGEETASILEHARVGPDWYTLAVHAPRLAAAARPGQFAQVCVHDPDLPITTVPLLRRPLSFCTVAEADGRVSFTYRVVGLGTTLLASRRVGDRLRLLGPLGRSFPDPARHPGRPLLLLGGGLGIPPLAFAASWARAAGRPVEAVLGARSAAYLAGAAEVAATGVPVLPVTEDGSAGHTGRITAVLGERLAPGVEVWACGPGPMLTAIRDLCAAAGADCWLCLERPMACGFGVCIGCAVARSDGQGYLKACVDGPVFPAGAVEP